ncbi:PKD domain-containing protein [Draconibacterium sediminis]|uniref:PKD domain-containing protein n=1 Tax=Draconibacterium sediminis TaxID=1544798 RepID=UPI0026EF61A2|nr:PKD domain-containing protein [Draconibacterium sediminis]
MKKQFKILTLLAVLAFAFTACDDNDSASVTAGFTYAPEENIQAGDTVFFTNTSSEAVSYEWSFGDTETSTEANPFHIYTEPGIYDVTLIAVNGGVSNTVTHQVNVDASLAFIVNAGSWSGDKSTITAYNKYTDEVVNSYYNSVNGLDITSNIQFAYNYNGKIYMMGNTADQVFWVDAKTFEQTENGITNQIVGPRNCQARGDYLYVSCWGGKVYNDPTLSYIAKVDLTAGEVVKTIPVHYGPEGLAIAGNKLYAALNYTNQVAVIDLDSDEVSYIDLPEGNIPSYFEKDDQDNLYINLGVAYDDETTQTGIGYINTSTDEFEAKYILDGVSSMNYVDVFEFNDDFSKLYIVTTGGYGMPGGVSVFDVASKSFEAEKFIDGVNGLNGLGYYDDKLFCFFSDNVTSNGSVITYSPDGTELNEFETGIAPFMLLTVE